MEKVKFNNLLSRLHVYQDEEIERVLFINSLSLGFIESIANGCEFLNSTNLIFHKTKIKGCRFIGRCQNIIFDGCQLDECDFCGAKLLQITFANKTTIKATTGLPPVKWFLESGLPHSKRT